MASNLRPSHRPTQVMGDVLLTLAALAGTICIAVVVAAFAFNVTLIMFKTGSMSPTIPAGSLAVVREIAASEIQVDDVVTVDRAGALPVTHRVTSVLPGPTDAEREITLKGDANEVEDPAPYTVSTVRIVLASVPELARVVVWLANPWIVGVITIGASALVAWAFWPRRREDVRQEEVRQERRQRDRRRDRRQPARHSHRTASLLAVVALLGGAALSAVAPPAPAIASEVTHGRFLTLTSIGDPTAMMNLVPGWPVSWQVGVAVDSPDPGTVQISLRATGSTALGLRASVASCAEPWISDECATGAHVIHQVRLLDVGGAAEVLAVMPSPEERWFLFRIDRAIGAHPVVNEQAQLTLHAEGAGEHADIGTAPGDAVAATGIAPGRPFLLAASAVLAGLLIAGVARWRRRASA